MIRREMNPDKGNGMMRPTWAGHNTHQEWEDISGDVIPEKRKKEREGD